MNKLLVSSCIALAAGGLSAATTVSGVTVSQDPATLVVTVQYSLAKESADDPDSVIVTADVKANGVSLAGHLDYLRGDVNKRLSVGGVKTFTWHPQKEGFSGPISSVTVDLKAWRVTNPPDYMVVDLAAKENVWYYENKDLVPFGVTNGLYKTTQLVMRKIPANAVRWQQGKASPTANTGEQKQRWCTLRHDYFMSIYEFTRGQYKLVNGSTSYNDSQDCPVYNIGFETLRGATASYDWPAKGHSVGSSSVIGKLRALTGLQFDLPTGAEWEYACRAGTSGATYGTLADIAWYNKSVNAAQPVGLKAANNWGLYDMIGNVFEYCLDWMSYDAESADTEVEDPQGPSEYTALSNRGNGGRMWRGGCYDYGATYATATYPYTWGKVGTAAVLGFRVCCPVEEE